MDLLVEQIVAEIKAWQAEQGISSGRCTLHADEEPLVSSRLENENKALVVEAADEIKPRRKGPPDLRAAVLSFPARLVTYVREKCGGDAALAYRRAGISRQLYSHFVGEEGRRADKLKVMQLCIGLRLTVTEAERLMKSAGYAFSGSLTADRVFLLCLERNIHDIRDVDAILRRCDEPGLQLA